MMTLTAVFQSIEVVLKSLAGPGNIIRELTQTGPEPVATISVSVFFLLPVFLLMGQEYWLRQRTGRPHVLIPDYLWTVPPDGGFSTWALLLVFAVSQGPLSAVI